MPESILGDKRVRIYFLIYLLFLAVLLFTWIALQVKFYSRVLPFFDSLAYQSSCYEISRYAKAHGWFKGVLNAASWPSANTWLLPIFTSLISPLGLQCRSVLCAYYMPIHFTALVLLYLTLLRYTRSSLCAFIGPFLLLGAQAFSVTIYGILDQRLEPGVLSFYVIICACLLNWYFNPSYRAALAVGIATSLGILHRPVFVLQALPILAATFVLSVVTTNELRIRKFKQLGLMAVMCSLLTLPFFIYQFNLLKNYYLEASNGGFIATYYDSLLLYVSLIPLRVGWFTIILSAALISFTLIARMASVWLVALLISIFVGPILPPILNKVADGVVIYPCMAVFGFLPIVIKKDACRSRICKATLCIFLLISVAGTVNRLYELNNRIQSTDDSLRRSEDKLIEEIARLHLPEPVYISGFHSDGVDPATLVFLARTEKGLPFDYGIMGAHPSEFGIKEKDTSNLDKNTLDRCVETVMEAVFKKGGLIILVDPEKVNDVHLAQSTFSHRIEPLIVKKFIDSGRLTDLNIGVAAPVPVKVYSVR
jgi:hypothetical protein